MINLGLTGSIGMGKSTTAAMFTRRGVPVFDADYEVHRLYSAGGRGVAEVLRLCPEAEAVNGGIDRNVLASSVRANPQLLPRIEAAIHPLIARARGEFLAHHRRRNTPLVVLDIPLLFEKSGEDLVDYILVVSASAKTQRDRVLARPGMTTERFEHILSLQMPDTQKRKKADFVIETDHGLAHAQSRVDDLIAQLHRRARRNEKHR
jgi:dephospho-CoA kinase